MQWSTLPRFEWLLFDGALMGFLVWQMISIRRLVRIDREQARQAALSEAPATHPRPVAADAGATAGQGVAKAPARPRD